jgi:hypothetical protein
MHKTENYIGDIFMAGTPEPTNSKPAQKGDPDVRFARRFFTGVILVLAGVVGLNELTYRATGKGFAGHSYSWSETDEQRAKREFAAAIKHYTSGFATEWNKLDEEGRAEVTAAISGSFATQIGEEGGFFKARGHSVEGVRVSITSSLATDLQATIEATAKLKDTDPKKQMASAKLVCTTRLTVRASAFAGMPYTARYHSMSCNYTGEGAATTWGQARALAGRLISKEQSADPSVSLKNIDVMSDNAMSAAGLNRKILDDALAAAGNAARKRAPREPQKAPGL